MGNIYARAIFAEMHGEQAYARHSCSVVKHTCGTWSRTSKTRALVFNRGPQLSASSKGGHPTDNIILLSFSAKIFDANFISYVKTYNLVLNLYNI